jgi:hypothetical protein
VRSNIDTLLMLIRIEDETAPETMEWTEEEIAKLLDRGLRYIRRFKFASKKNKFLRLCKMLEREYSESKKTNDFRNVHSLLEDISKLIPEYFT